MMNVQSVRALLPALCVGFALAAPSGALADVMKLDEGDVSCLGYDEAAQDCASIQRGRTLPDGRVVIADETHFVIEEQNFAIASGFIAEQRDGMLCVDPDTIAVNPLPISNPIARKIAVEIKVQMAVAAREGVCVRHRSCGADTVADFVVGDEVMQGMSSRFRIFRSGAPEIDSLRPRRIGVAGLAVLRAPKTDDCGVESAAMHDGEAPALMADNSN